MKKIISEIFFYITFLMLISIFVSVIFYNGKSPLPHIPFLVIILVFFTSYFVYGWASHTLTITKEDYKNKKMYVITRGALKISGIISSIAAWFSMMSKTLAVILWIVIAAIFIIDRKQTSKV